MEPVFAFLVNPKVPFSNIWLLSKNWKTKSHRFGFVIRAIWHKQFKL